MGNKVEKGAGLGEELEKLKRTDEESKQKTGKIRELEEELRKVKLELQHEKDEKVDLVSEKVRGEEEAVKQQEEMMLEVTRLKKELEKSKLLADSVNQIDPELLARMEEEKTAIHSEYEQERIAYQKLLKDFNMLEASNDDLKEKLNMLRGDKHDRTISSVSLSSNMQEEDYMSLESAYGGSSGISGTSSNNDVGLMMKLQAALKEVHREKDQLEKKLEEMESGNGDRQTLDTLKIQDLEVENN